MAHEVSGTLGFRVPPSPNYRDIFARVTVLQLSVCSSERPPETAKQAARVMSSTSTRFSPKVATPTTVCVSRARKELANVGGY